MDEIALRAKEAGAKPLQGPCTLIVTATFPIPPSWTKTKQEAALKHLVPHISKPDVDNLYKIVSDSLNEVAYVDDSQVTWANVRKVYGLEPQIVVSLTYTE